MLPGHIENVLSPAALEHFIKGVELLGLRQLGNVSRVDKESRRSGHRVDAIESNLEGLRHIFVCLFAEADVAIADLEKAEIRSRRQRVSSCFCDLGESSRRKHPAAYGPKQARAGPCHAVEKAAAIDSVVFVVVRNVIGHNIGFWFGCLAGCLTPIFTDSTRFYSRNLSHQSASRGNFPQFLLLGCYFSTLVFAKTPRSGV